MPEAPGPLADEPFEPSVLESEVVFEGKVWNVRRDRFQFGDSEITREYVDHTGAVAVLAIDDSERILLIRQYRHPIRSKDWELPAGLLDQDGEDLVDAAKRELAEEVDLKARTWNVLADFHSTPGGSDEALRIYLARDLVDMDEPFERTDEEADIVKRWVHLDEAVDGVLAGRLSNSILQIAVLTASVARTRGWNALRPADAPPPTRTKG